jgi:phosphohistidine phosphatase SixA
MTGMTMVYLVQHGEKQRLPGDPGLTQLGRQQATRTGRWLSGHGVSALWTSPLRRARETADCIAAVTGLAVQPDARLEERLNWDGDPGHLGQAEQVNRDVCEFLAYVLAPLAPGVKGLGHLPVQQAELKRHIGRVEAFATLFSQASFCPDWMSIPLPGWQAGKKNSRGPHEHGSATAYLGSPRESSRATS